MIQIAICDDEEKSLSSLKELLEEIMNEYSISYHISEFDSGEKLLETDLAFHIIFLDIVMDGENGIEIGRQIYQRNHWTKIIFQTNYGVYCKEAVNQAHAFAFLEKPLQRAEVEVQIKNFIAESGSIKGIQTEFQNVKMIQNHVEIKRKVLSVPVKSIIFFECLKTKKEIKCMTQNGDFVFSDYMKHLENRMQPFGFETCCRGILVNLEKVMQVKRYTIFLSNGVTVPLSQKRAVEFKEKLNEYIHNSLS